MLGGGLAGTALGIPASIGTYEVARAGGLSPDASYILSAAPRGAMLGGGLALGLNHGLKNLYNDIAQKRLSGEFK